MPMELFVNCADDLSTFRGPAMMVIPARLPPGTDNLLSPGSLLFLFTWLWAVERFPCPDDSLAFWTIYVFRMSS